MVTYIVNGLVVDVSAIGPFILIEIGEPTMKTLEVREEMVVNKNCLIKTNNDSILAVKTKHHGISKTLMSSSYILDDWTDKKMPIAFSTHNGKLYLVTSDIITGDISLHINDNYSADICYLSTCINGALMEVDIKAGCFYVVYKNSSSMINLAVIDSSFNIIYDKEVYSSVCLYDLYYYSKDLYDLDRIRKRALQNCYYFNNDKVVLVQYYSDELEFTEYILHDGRIREGERWGYKLKGAEDAVLLSSTNTSTLLYKDEKILVI